jgi:DNA-binding GntR family transcriptional regulator
MTNLLLYQRIAQQLAEDIRRGVYQPGERVPSVRKMSSQLNVSHATVLQAYANLEDQGLIRARPQSGYYVHQTSPGSSVRAWSLAAASFSRYWSNPAAKVCSPWAPQCRASTICR